MTINITNCPVWEEYQRQTQQDPDALVNLTLLWRAAGSPRGRSPRQRYHGTDEIVLDEGGRNGSCFGDANTALCYAQILDHKLMRACGEVFFRQLDADPAGNIAGCPNGIMAIFAIPAMMKKEGVGPHEAREHLIREVVERSNGLDAYAQETTVAKVQRAVAAVRVVEVDGEPGE
jgi:hypothetical protein